MRSIMLLDSVYIACLYSTFTISVVTTITNIINCNLRKRLYRFTSYIWCNVVILYSSICKSICILLSTCTMVGSCTIDVILSFLLRRWLPWLLRLYLYVCRVKCRGNHVTWRNVGTYKRSHSCSMKVRGMAPFIPTEWLGDITV